MRWEGSYARLARMGLGLVLGLLGAVLVIGPAITQNKQPGVGLPNPRLFIVSPAGGKIATSIEVVCTGQDIDESQSLLFSHPGIKADLVEAAPVVVADPKTKAPPKGGPLPGVTAKFKVTIAPDVPVGIHDVRIVSKWGVSNPRAFVVGDQIEEMEKEPNNDVEQAQKVALNTTINGAITAPTDVDYFSFSGKKGQRVVVSCLASSIDSRLHATIELYDSMGRQIGFNRNYQGTDALADLTLPNDGDYTVRLYQFTHTLGNPEYFYRLTITTAPWIDAVFPVVVEPGKPTQVTVHGRNLPGGQPDPTAIADGRVLEKAVVTVNAPNDPLTTQRLSFNGYVSPPSGALDGFEYRLKNGSGSSNGYLVTFARAPVVLDNGTNETMETAQQVSVPCEIAGRIEKRRDRDWYSFDLKKDETVYIEVMGERIGSPADMVFSLVNPATKQMIAEQDDSAETLTPFKFSTRTSDPPRTAFRAPADGKYLLLVTSHDADTQSGPRYLYRVSITPAQPDYRLILMPEDPRQPDGCVVRQGSSHYYEIYVWRRDGWNGEVTLSVEGLPQGVTCVPQTVGHGLAQGTLVVTAAADAPPWAGSIKVKGTAKIAGKDVVREARPASITWPVAPQQNIITVSRLDRNIALAVRDRPPYSLTASIDKNTIFQGEKANVTLKVNRLWPDFKAPVQATVVGAPPGQPKGAPAGMAALPTLNNGQPVQVPPDKNEAVAVFEAKQNTPPGTYTFALRAQGQMPFSKDPMAKIKPNINVIQASTPFMVTVLPKSVATVGVSNAKPAVKIGMQTEIVVRVTRLYDYGGEFKVQLVFPPNVKGLSAADVTIPAGQDEAKLVIAAAPETPAGVMGEILVRATAKYKDVDTTQETKIAVTVQK